MNDLEPSSSWPSIEARLKQLYPNQKEFHWGTVHRYSTGGPDPLDGISAFDAKDHWHFVSFGLTEINGKNSENPEISGWGIELSLRIKKSIFQFAPPKWPLVFMQRLAQYVFDEKRPFAEFHYIRYGGPIFKGSKKTAILFGIDPTLASLETETGRLTFVSPFFITEGEFAQCQESFEAPEQLLRKTRSVNPQFVNNLK